MGCHNNWTRYLNETRQPRIKQTHMKKFLSKIIQNLSFTGKPPDKETVKDIISHAVATLLYEATRVDDDVSPDDLKIAANELTNITHIDLKEAENLLISIALPENRLTSYQPTVKIINEHFSYKQKCDLILAMWKIAHSDDDIDPHEDHIIRKISDLLYIKHRDFIHQKLNARSESTLRDG